MRRRERVGDKKIERLRKDLEEARGRSVHGKPEKIYERGRDEGGEVERACGKSDLSSCLAGRLFKAWHSRQC